MRQMFFIEILDLLLSWRSWKIIATLLKGQYHEKSRWPTFNQNQILFENKPSKRIQFLNILSCSRDIHLIKQAN